MHSQIELLNEIDMNVDLGMGRTRQAPAYRINRDGFTLLACGFNGKDALKWKLAYIDTFNKMECQLLEQQRQPARDCIDAIQAQKIKELVQAVALTHAISAMKIWPALCEKFLISNYLELPACNFRSAQQYLLNQLANGPQPTLRGRRWLIETARDGSETVTPIQDCDFVTSAALLPQEISSGFLSLSPQQLISVASACMARLQEAQRQPAMLLG